MNWQDRIAIDPAVLVGKPVIKGTRLAVEFVIDLLAQGWTEADVLKNYPGLTREDVLACLAYAGERLRSEKVYPLETRETFFGRMPPRWPASAEEKDEDQRRLRETAKTNPAVAAALEVAAGGGPDVDAIIAQRARG
jgi:uncharacterized protein (DUF433 family)